MQDRTVGCFRSYIISIHKKDNRQQDAKEEKQTLNNNESKKSI